MNTLNKQSFLRPFAQSYNSIHDIKFRKKLDGVAITSAQCNNKMVITAAALPIPRPPHFPKKLIVYFFILLLLITPTKQKNKYEYPKYPK